MELSAERVTEASAVHIHPALFECIDPEATMYPAPALPILPYLTASQLLRGPRDLPIFLSRPHQFFRNARSALAQVFTQCGLHNNHILVPGYICKSVIEPIIWSGSTPVFYNLNDDLSVDETDFEAKLVDADAAIVTHFFGIPQHIDRLAELCRRQQVILIEDCAHALMGALNGAPLGSLGDYSIASTIKFCPGIDGGILICNGPTTTDRREPRTTHVDLRSIASLLERSVTGYVSRYGNRSYSSNHVPPVPRWRSSRMRELEQSPGIDGRYEWFDPEDMGIPGNEVSRRLLFMLDYDLIRRRRRENFLHYVEVSRGLARCQAIITELQAETVPYMFPLFVEGIDDVFRTLKFRRIPIWRWEQQHVNVPAIGKRLGRGLLHLPCHQCITLRDIDKIIAAIRDSLQF